MSVVSSMTTMAPEPSIEPALSTGRLVERQVEVLLEEPRRRRAAGDERLELRPSADAAAVLGRSKSSRNVVTPFGTSNTPGCSRGPTPRTCACRCESARRVVEALAAVRA
jgi:hypothetical protein